MWLRASDTQFCRFAICGLYLFLNVCRAWGFKQRLNCGSDKSWLQLFAMPAKRPALRCGHGHPAAYGSARPSRSAIAHHAALEHLGR